MAGIHGVFGFSGRGPIRKERKKKKERSYLLPEEISNPILVSSDSEIEEVLNGRLDIKGNKTPDVIIIESE